MKAWTIIFVLLFGLQSSHILAGTNEGSFTPDSILTPIREVRLTNANSSADTAIYECAADNETDCLVDVTDNTALQDLVSTVEIDTGDYNQIRVGNCKDEGGYSAKVRGTVVLGGTTYYTASGSNPLSTNIGDLDYVTVSFTGCSSEYNLPHTVSVTSETALRIMMFLAVENIAWARLGSATIPSGCKENAGQTQSVCMAYPDVVAYVGETTPTLEVYHVCEGGGCAANTSGAQVLLLFDNNNNILGGFTRRLFSQTSVAASFAFDTPLKSSADNGDSTYTIENFGSTAVGPGYVKFDDFRRSNHQSTYTSPQSGGAPVTYNAQLQ